MPTLLPYDRVGEDRSWYYAQYVLNALASMLYDRDRFGSNALLATNPRHDARARERGRRRLYLARSLNWSAPAEYLAGSLTRAGARHFCAAFGAANRLGHDAERPPREGRRGRSYVVPLGFLARVFRGPLLERARAWRARHERLFGAIEEKAAASTAAFAPRTAIKVAGEEERRRCLERAREHAPQPTPRAPRAIALWGWWRDAG